MAAPTPSKLRYSRFLALLFQDGETQARFEADPDAEMKDNGLSSKQRKLILEALEDSEDSDQKGFADVLREAWIERERPFPDDQ